MIGFGSDCLFQYHRRGGGGKAFRARGARGGDGIAESVGEGSALCMNAAADVRTASQPIQSGCRVIDGCVCDGKLKVRAFEVVNTVFRCRNAKMQK